MIDLLYILTLIFASIVFEGFTHTGIATLFILFILLFKILYEKIESTFLNLQMC